VRPFIGDKVMIVIAGIVLSICLVYLVYAIIRPDRF
jgi:K+-transporting ATPase KdpF subunit